MLDVFKIRFEKSVWILYLNTIFKLLYSNEKYVYFYTDCSGWKGICTKVFNEKALTQN